MLSYKTIRSMLAEGRSRLSIGRAGEVAALVLAQPSKASDLMKCLWDEDPAVANRAADALEKVSHALPSVLNPWKAPLLGLLAEATQNKLRWHLAIIVPRLKLTGAETKRVADVLRTYLEDQSSIVKTCAMQGLADLTSQNSSLLQQVLDLLRVLSRTGSPAMRARGRLLLVTLEATEEIPKSGAFQVRKTRSSITPENRNRR